MSGMYFYALIVFGMIILSALEWNSQSFKISFASLARRKRNLAYIFATTLTMVVIISINSFLAKNIPHLLRLDSIPLIDFIGCFLFAELFNYVFHLAKHKNSFLWKFHFQHHVEDNYNILLTTHLHGLEVVISGTIMSICMNLIGFSELAVNCYVLFYSLANTFQHSARNYNIGWLEKIIVAPKYHRIHHSKDFDGNYGSTLTFWDIIFKTAIWPKKDQWNLNIGIKNNGEPFDFHQEMIYFYGIKKENERAFGPSTHSASIQVKGSKV